MRRKIVSVAQANQIVLIAEKANDLESQIGQSFLMCARQHMQAIARTRGGLSGKKQDLIVWESGLFERIDAMNERIKPFVTDRGDSFMVDMLLIMRKRCRAIVEA